MSNGDDLARGGLFSSIEKATDFNFFLQSSAFVLFLDSMFVRLHGKGMFDLIQNAANLDRSIALETSLLFLVFSFCVTVIIPVTGGIIDPLFIAYVSPVLSWLKDIGNTKDAIKVRYERKYNCATSSELRDAAHEQQSSFLLGLYNQHDEKRRERNRASIRSGFYAFCALTLLGVNYWGASTTTAISMTRRIVGYCDSSVPIWVALGFLVILTYRRFHEDDSGDDWIYHPPLYKVLKAEEDARYAEVEDFAKRAKRLEK